MMYNIMLDMKTATIRQVCHDFRTVLAWVAKGEEVTVLNRTRPVARICPARAEAATPFKMPDFAARSKALFGNKVLPNTVLQEREESRW
jgi:antitoxin (DNA-binding transcriptional repressor) of toxin-antitoxin stability system